MSDSDQGEGRPAMPRVNRRITALILSFAILSGLCSVLPLVPGIREWIPLGLMSRQGALTLYSGALLAFTAFFMPLYVVDAEERASLGAWWWLGGLIFVFAAVPLYTLAYIAGVHRDAVLEILAWAGVLHGAALIVLHLLSFRRLAVLVTGAFALLVVLPASDAFAQILELRAERFAWLPSSRVLALTQGYAEPRPGLALAILVGLHLLLYALSRRQASSASLESKSKVAALLLGAGALLTVAAAPVSEALRSEAQGAAASSWGSSASSRGSSAPSGGSSAPSWVSPTLDRWVPGRAFPLRVEVAPGTSELEVRVGDREQWVWRPAAGQSRLWLQPQLARAGERIEVRADGGEAVAITPELLPADRVLVLVWGGAELRSGLATAQAARPQVLLRDWDEESWPTGRSFFDPFSGFILDAEREAGLDLAERAALEDFAASGGHVYVLGADAPSRRRLGEGVIERQTSRELADFGRLSSRRRQVAAAGLYDRFALPDWGRVDLRSLLIFLLVYHLVFLLIFLLPLRYDARKRLAVYLVSVGFVLALVVLASYFALTRRLLPKTQVLQQDLLAAVLHEEGPWLAVEELICFASFNEAPARIEIADRRGVSPVYRELGLGVGRVEIEGAKEALVFPALPLDRFARKQVFSFRESYAAPFVLEEGRTRWEWSLSPRPEVADRRGFLESERRFAFARIEGSLHAVEISGNQLRISSEPLARAWDQVGPQGAMATETRAFLRSLLSRHCDRNRDLIAVVMTQIPPRHRSESYLSRREILQTLLLPLPDK
jgi:hypothetical protein